MPAMLLRFVMVFSLIRAEFALERLIWPPIVGSGFNITAGLG
jgi:hypothetical protein